jgi:phosphoglycolate phosphatase
LFKIYLVKAAYRGSLYKLYRKYIKNPPSIPIQPRETFKKQETPSQRESGMKNQKLTVKAVLIDLDGTIVDSTDAYVEAAKQAFQAVGQPLPSVKAALEIPRRLEQGLSIQDITRCEPKQFLPTYLKTYYSVTQAKTKLLPDVALTLGALSKKTKLALITMRYVPSSAVIKELENFGISQYFVSVVTALDTSKPKPSPQALIKCTVDLGVEMADCIMAGDSVNDVRAGKAAGAGTVAFLSGLFLREELERENPDFILPDVNSLPAFFERRH